MNGDGEIFQEKKSSSQADNRTQLKACLKHLRKRDFLVITKLDRLARSTYDLTQIANDLETRGIDLVVLDQAINTSTPTGKLLFNMLGSIAEFESTIRKERQTDGIARAKELGVKFGAKAKLTPEQVEELKKKYSEGVKIKDLMETFGLSKASIYRLLGKAELVNQNH